MCTRAVVSLAPSCSLMNFDSTRDAGLRPACSMSLGFWQPACCEQTSAGRFAPCHMLDSEQTGLAMLLCKLSCTLRLADKASPKRHKTSNAR